MSEKIGNMIPAPLRFEMGVAEIADSPIKAYLLVSVDQEYQPRVAVLAPTEMVTIDERRLRFRVHVQSTTQKNLRRTLSAMVWCVLDGAAYSIRGGAQPIQEEGDSVEFEMSVAEVLRDYYPDAPMISGPTFKRLKKEPSAN
ncbi:MAG: hypothetical protein JO219_06710 [Candidatus Eremiobacteraeota bacterium]|nr:hypothetical protein [Candidatus Eremiobacteraeota bacterium]MBV8366231.1 hypothetical protein [Candidatus Eremiobacteraeota bacterium]